MISSTRSSGRSTARRGLLGITTALVLATAVATILPAQQPNTPNASMVFGGIDGPSWPVLLPINVQSWGSSLSLQISGVPLQPFVLVSAPAGVLAPGVTTPHGMLDLDLSGGYDVLLDGLGLTTPTPLSLFANTTASGTQSFVFSISPAAAGLSLGLQCLVANPASPTGLTFSAATFLTTVSVPDNAFFVSHSRGSLNNPGTAGEPFLTLSQGIAAALAAGFPYPAVRVEAGNYAEIGGFSLYEGIDVTGGLDDVTFSPIPGARSVVQLGAGSATIDMVIQHPTTITALELAASDATAPGAPSIALEVANCGPLLAFVDCMFVAGNGAPGANGSSGGIQGPAGQNGGSGGAHDIAPGVGGSPGGGFPFDGGAGGVGGGGSGPNAGANGVPGQGPGGNNGQGGAAGGGCGAGNGTSGSPGSHGSGGPGGSAVDLFGLVVWGHWIPGWATAGANGGAGRGGGGGGGGALTDCLGLTSGHGGGGGGGGGGPGGSGGGAQNGGASFAVHCHYSSAVFQNCTFQAGDGGAGGTGGNGAAGGAGGGAGSGPGTTTGAGGNGGRGGHGGGGGGGGGGHGGPSLCVFHSGFAGSSLPSGNTFMTGTGGAGGSGGTGGPAVTALSTTGNAGSPGQAGSTGPAGTVF